MFIQHIAIENFGAICHYDTELRQGLNVLESRYTTELYEAIAFLVCNDQVPGIPEQWLRDDLLISATICLEDTVYTVCIRSVLGRPQMFATDPTGADATEQYQYALSHCEEQNGAELFDGDAVTVIKDLKVKGSSMVIKRGTKVKSIRLTDNPEEVDCKIDGSSIVLKTCFLKK